MRPFGKSVAALAAAVLLVGALGCSPTETEDARGTAPFSSQGTGKGDSPRRFSDAATARRLNSVARSRRPGVRSLAGDAAAGHSRRLHAVGLSDLQSARSRDPPSLRALSTARDCVLLGLRRSQRIADAIRRHLREYNYPCPGLRNPRHTLVDYCQATTTPEAVVFNRDQTMAYRGRINNLYEELGQPRAEATTHELADAIEATLQDGRSQRRTFKLSAAGSRICDREGRATYRSDAC